jgi:hypothetical protein
MNRRLLLIGGLSLFPLTFSVLWLALPGDPINAANFDRIEVGMTQQEVVEILGKPDQEGEEAQVIEGDHKWLFRCWSRPSWDTIIVCFNFHDGRWIVESKQCRFHTLWERATHWWNGGQPEGRAMRLEPAA